MQATANQKKGLTAFGWLVLGGAAAAFLSNKERRDKVLNGVRDFTGKFGSGQNQGAAPTGQA